MKISSSIPGVIPFAADVSVSPGSIESVSVSTEVANEVARISTEKGKVEAVEIRDATRRDQFRALLEEGFPNVPFDWQIAFRAPPGECGHGVLLLVNGEPQGGLLAFEKTEMLGGRARRVVNFSSWYVRPEHRCHAIRMVSRLTDDPDAIYTGCTAIASTRAIARRFGFRFLSKGSIASLPLLNGFSRKEGIRIEPYVSQRLDPQSRNGIDDHLGPGTIAQVIRMDDRRVPVLWSRGWRFRAFSAVRLLYTSDHAALREALPAIHLDLLRRGIVALYLPRIEAYREVRSALGEGRGPSLIVKGEVADEEVNLLYSELHYLPLYRRPLRRRLLSAGRKALRRLKKTAFSRAVNRVRSAT